ncbi:MAG TPA: SDR family NAD(P)-dependent oxidoreductase [Terracidiphilus sp.]|jgi:NADP-dependent 3-hydroxy acid dehydrogenase YdfG
MAQKTALVIGASGGLGCAIARMLAEEGYALALVGRNVTNLEAVRNELGAAAKNALILSCDLTDRAQAQAMVEQALAHLGVIDVLICAAGMNVRQRSLRSLDPADWDRVIAANLTTAFNAIHFVLPSMRTRGGGLIVQISSLAGLRANTITGAAYSAAKFAQGALGVSISREERGRGIRSTVIYSGEVDTPLLEARGERVGVTVNEGRRESILQPKDISDAVRLLVNLPPRAHIPELVIKPTIDDFS